MEKIQELNQAIGKQADAARSELIKLEQDLQNVTVTVHMTSPVGLMSFASALGMTGHRFYVSERSLNDMTPLQLVMLQKKIPSFLNKIHYRLTEALKDE